MGDILLYVLIAVLVYVGWLLFWGVVCLLAYSLSLVFKKNAIINAVLGFNVLLIQLWNFAIGIGLLYYTFYLLFHGQFLWFVVMLFVGIGLISGVMSWLNMPFLVITAYFADKVEKTNADNDIIEAEIVDENHKVIGKIGSESEISRRLSKFFLIAYGLNLVNLFLNASEYPDYHWFDYITMPAIWVGTSSLVVGLIFGLYYLVRWRKFFYPRKKLFLIKTLKTVCFLLGGIWLLTMALRFLYSV